MAAIDPSLSALAQSVRGAAAEISEAARELGRYASRTGGDPRRLEDIEERLEVLRKLARKHGGSLQSALQRREQMKAELAALENHDEELGRRTAVLSPQPRTDRLARRFRHRIAVSLGRRILHFRLSGRRIVNLKVFNRILFRRGFWALYLVAHGMGDVLSNG